MLNPEPAEAQPVEMLNFAQTIAHHCRTFFRDPIGYVIDAALYLLLLGVAISVLIGVGKGVFERIWDSF